jgi:molecular chaperone HscB
VNLQSNDFELFGLSQQFAQDRTQLDARWKELQREVHPDNFAGQGATEQRIAMQWSVRINEAYQRLKTPLARAAYLCELAGEPVGADRNTAMPAAFLMQQMQWREAMEEARDLQTLETLQTEVSCLQNQLMQECASLIDEKADYAAAVVRIRSLLFIDKFGRDLELRFEALEN